MKKYLAAVALCLLASSTPASAKVPFVLKRLNKETKLAIVMPMLPVQFLVSQESGALELTGSEVLQCKVKPKEQKITVNGAEATLIETMLDCGDKKFVIRGIDFEGAGK